MKRISKLLTMAILSGLFLNSCSSDDGINEPEVPQPEGTYTDGFFVLNEGNSSGGSVSFVDNGLQGVEQEIFQQVNEGEDLGLFTQSIFFNDDHAFIISNGSNLISVVDRYTFELIGKVESGLEVPMFGVAKNGKAYVTNLASFDTEIDDFIAVINLETLEVEETIDINATAEYIVEDGGLLYVQNASYGSGNRISVINPMTNSVEDTFETNNGLSDFDIEDGFIYALSATQLEKIDLSSGEVISEITFEKGSASNLDIEDGMIYYTMGTAVYRFGVNDEIAPEEPLLTYTSNSDYGAMYGFVVENDRIYIADGGDFSSNSFIEVYTIGGELLENLEVGVGPNNFYFNE